MPWWETPGTPRNIACCARRSVYGVPNNVGNTHMSTAKFVRRVAWSVPMRAGGWRDDQKRGQCPNGLNDKNKNMNGKNLLNNDLGLRKMRTLIEDRSIVMV